LVKSVTHLSSYRTRGANTDTGVAAAHWFRDQFQAIINNLPEERKKLFSVKLFAHSNFRQPSVIATLKGKTSEIVILGGHEDSTASGGIAPGADDDASGSSSVLESFRIIAQSNFAPTKTVEFHCYAAEEMGLLGSRAIAQEYKRNNARVFGMMQLVNFKNK
jgi:bacterial leucyl aminopeptidase